MATIHTDKVAEVLARVREGDPPVFNPAEHPEVVAYRRGLNAAWHMVTFGLADVMAADHPRWDRDRFYDLADGVDV